MYATLLIYNSDQPPTCIHTDRKVQREKPSTGGMEYGRNQTVAICASHSE